VVGVVRVTYFLGMAEMTQLGTVYSPRKHLRSVEAEIYLEMLWVGKGLVFISKTVWFLLDTFLTQLGIFLGGIPCLCPPHFLALMV